MRRRTLALARAAAIVCALVTGAPIASAEDPALTPPKLARFVPADDPRVGETAARASVELALDVDREGAVTSALVLRSGGDELDAAALRAARAFTFEPATRDGRPVAARIRYEYVFAARAPAPPSAPAPRPVAASVGGVVLDRDAGEPIVGAGVIVTTDAGDTFRATTDARGAFRVDGVPPGPAHVVVTAEGHVAARLDETLEPGVLTEAKLPLDRTPDPDAYGATARVDAPPREVTRRTLAREELTRVAGTRGDPLRAIELLPGVGRAPGLSDSNPILRGANPVDTQVFLEGAPVPLLYHFGGLTSFVHGRALDAVEVYPSNFGVRYGRKVGGVVDARLRDPRADRLHGLADISLIDSSVLVETPVGEKVAVLAAARRSNLDAVLRSANSLGESAAITAAPVYWDYQAVAAYRPTDDDRLRLVAYGSSDRLAVLQSQPDEDNPASRGAYDFATAFHRVMAGYRHRWAGGSEQNTELTYGRTNIKGTVGRESRFDFVTNDVQARSEWTGVVSPAVRLVAGVDALASHFRGEFEGTAPSSSEGDRPTSAGAQARTRLSASLWHLQPGAYVEAGLRPTSSLLVVPGIRADYSGLVARGSVDPRLSARWEVSSTTALKAGVGRFSQAPQESEAVEPIGNPKLGLTRATHVSAGVEQAIFGPLTASVEGFAKWVDGIVVGTPGGRPPFFVNAGEGRIFGAEVLLRAKPSGRFFGFVSYTLMRSERRDASGAWRLFDRDMPHILGAAGVYRLGRGWEIAASVRYTSGAPYTPVVSSTYDATADVYVPRLGRAMSARNPSFSRLDVRLEKKWTFSRWTLAAYLDVQNVLNSENREGWSYSYDYAQREGQRGLPILPSIGLRGEL